MESDKRKSWQLRLHEIIYGSATPAGKLFDISLLILIIASIILVILDSSAEWRAEYGELFRKLDLAFTIVFTIEYILRLICIKRPLRYVFSFLGLVDLLAIIPGYLSLFFGAGQSLFAFRALRLLRIFRIFKLSHYLAEMKFLSNAINGSIRKSDISPTTSSGKFVASVIMLMIGNYRGTHRYCKFCGEKL